ncbi:DapH/DapD/GlmU-related protein [Bifidobacterium callitrichos]
MVLHPRGCGRVARRRYQTSHGPRSSNSSRGPTHTHNTTESPAGHESPGISHIRTHFVPDYCSISGTERAERVRSTHPVELADRLVEGWKPGDAHYRWNTYAKPIRIGRGCWLGGGVIVLPGVTIGDGTVIGAGSVVTRDIPANVVAVGNPCRVLRSINESDRSDCSASAARR